MKFKEALNIEEEFYNKYFRNWLIKKGYDLIYIRYDSENIIYNEIQKKKDIDIILDDGFKNISLSLKTVRNIYKNIFFETISNCNKNTQGWGYYSEADYIVYSMANYKAGFPKHFNIYKFKIDDILNNLNLAKYKKGWGKTYNDAGILLYKTEGRLIPLADFKHTVLES